MSLSILFSVLLLSNRYVKKRMANMINQDMEHRRKRLRQWINDNYGSQAAFIEKTGINQGELSGLLRNKSFGEKKARNLELLAGMPSKWLDQQDGQPSGAEIEQIPAMARPVPVIPLELAGSNKMNEWIADHPEARRFRPKACGERTFAVAAQDISMAPYIVPEMVVYIDPDEPLTPGRCALVQFEGAKTPVFRRLVADGGQEYWSAEAQGWIERFRARTAADTVIGTVIMRAMDD
ncbi:MAG: hypothetical protein EPN14_00550 [Gallionella sp.]|nr:MAG: hypothetical protein EPN14_00550 [Gallionella sp.]